MADERHIVSRRHRVVQFSQNCTVRWCFRMYFAIYVNLVSWATPWPEKRPP